MDILDYKALGERIRRQRQHLKLTQEQLAELIGVSHSYVGHIERGTRKASLETLVLLCKQLNVSADFLLQDSVPLTSYTLSEQLTPEQRAAVTSILHTLESTMLDWHSSSKK